MDPSTMNHHRLRMILNLQIFLLKKFPPWAFPAALAPPFLPPCFFDIFDSNPRSVGLLIAWMCRSIEGCKQNVCKQTKKKEGEMERLIIDRFIVKNHRNIANRNLFVKTKLNPKIAWLYENETKLTRKTAFSTGQVSFPRPFLCLAIK